MKNQENDPKTPRIRIPATRVHGDVEPDGRTYYCRRCDAFVPLDHDHSATVPRERPGAETGWREDLKRVDRGLPAATARGRAPWVRNVFLDRAEPELEVEAARARLKGHSVWSECGLYRYVLAYTWSERRPIATLLVVHATLENGRPGARDLGRSLFKDLFKEGFGGVVVLALFSRAVADLAELEAAHAQGLELTGGPPANAVLAELMGQRVVRELGPWPPHPWIQARAREVLGPLAGDP